VCFADVWGAIIAAIQSLQDLPGRSGRYKGPVDNIISLANRAGVVIYVLDAAGVVMEASDVGRRRGSRFRASASRKDRGTEDSWW
jgi:hypothetical protein